MVNTSPLLAVHNEYRVLVSNARRRFNFSSDGRLGYRLTNNRPRAQGDVELPMSNADRKEAELLKDLHRRPPLPASHGDQRASLALLLPLLLLSSFSLIRPGGSDTASDFAECGNALVGLQTCINYVQGASAAPTPDCCGGLKDVLAQSPKCLCVLIKDRDDPQLPVKINVTRALALPAACSAAANVSKCPSQLLNLPPNSPEAQVFRQTGNTTTQAKGNSSARTGTGTGTSPRPTPETSHGGRGWAVEREVVVGCLLYFVLFLVAT
ncbi:uncharacterized protein LOC141826301 [Curcuma longa]|uniref:uncharacterized protein LOC141826301 n=1 Tax=Curcuma longa TaxID=136217 RepID=UPI003D9EFEC1